jgi:hypothetical protein
MPNVIFIRPKLTREMLNERLQNFKLVAEDILNCECRVYFENESDLDIINDSQVFKDK